MAPANHSAVLLYFHFSLLDTFLVKVVQNQVDRLKVGEEMFYISWEFVDIVSWQMGGTFELLLTALKRYWMLLQRDADSIIECYVVFGFLVKVIFSCLWFASVSGYLCFACSTGNSVVEPLMTKCGGCLLHCGHCMPPFVAGIAWFMYFPLKWNCAPLLVGLGQDPEMDLGAKTREDRFWLDEGELDTEWEGGSMPWAGGGCIYLEQCSKVGEIGLE